MSIYFYKNSVWLETSRATIRAAVLGLWRSQVRLGLLNLRAGDHSLRRRFSFLGRKLSQDIFLQMAFRTQPHVPPKHGRLRVLCFVLFCFRVLCLGWVKRGTHPLSYPSNKRENSGKYPSLETGKPSTEFLSYTLTTQLDSCNTSTSLHPSNVRSFPSSLSFFLPNTRDSFLTSMKYSYWV